MQTVLFLIGDFIQSRYAIVPGKVVHADLRGTDIFAVKDGKASVTPLQTWPHGHPFGLLDSEMTAALCRKSLLGKYKASGSFRPSVPFVFPCLFEDVTRCLGSSLLHWQEKRTPTRAFQRGWSRLGLGGGKTLQLFFFFPPPPWMDRLSVD